MYANFSYDSHQTALMHATFKNVISSQSKDNCTRSTMHKTLQERSKIYYILFHWSAENVRRRSRDQQQLHTQIEKDLFLTLLVVHSRM